MPEMGTELVFAGAGCPSSAASLASGERSPLSTLNRAAQGGFFNIIFFSKLALMTWHYFLSSLQWHLECPRAAGVRLVVGLNLCFVLLAQNGLLLSLPSECIDVLVLGPCLHQPQTSTLNLSPLTLRGASVFP